MVGRGVRRRDGLHHTAAHRRWLQHELRRWLPLLDRRRRIHVVLRRRDRLLRPDELERKHRTPLRGRHRDPHRPRRPDLRVDRGLRRRDRLHDPKQHRRLLEPLVRGRLQHLDRCRWQGAHIDLRRHHGMSHRDPLRGLRQYPLRRRHGNAHRCQGQRLDLGTARDDPGRGDRLHHRGLQRRIQFHVVRRRPHRHGRCRGQRRRAAAPR